MKIEVKRFFPDSTMRDFDLEIRLNGGNSFSLFPQVLKKTEVWEKCILWTEITTEELRDWLSGCENTSKSSQRCMLEILLEKQNKIDKFERTIDDLKQQISAYKAQEQNYDHVLFE